MNRLTVAVALACASFASSAQDDICGRIIAHGMNNISMRTSSNSLADRMYWEFCDESYESLSEAKKKEFGVTIKGVPLSGSDQKHSDREKHAKFCGTYKTSTDIHSEEALLTSRMHDRAIDAWQQCVSAVQSGMFIDFRIPSSQKYVDIFMKYTGPATSTRFKGIATRGFTCRFGDDVVGPGSVLAITPAQTALRCERQSITQDVGGVTSEYFPDGGITVNTEAGNGSVEFVQMVDGPARGRFEQVDAQIAGVRSDVGGLAGYLGAWKGDESRGNKVGDGNASGTTTCPAGQYAVGFQYWGAPPPIRFCVGCASGFQVICRSLNTGAAK